MYDDGECKRCCSYECGADCFEFGSVYYLEKVEACRDRSQQRAEDAEERARVAEIEAFTLTAKLRRLEKQLEIAKAVVEH